MTDEQAKALGLRALALGMPWVRGLQDGWSAPRCAIDQDSRSWPDFRDPLTKAWFCRWACNKIDDESNWIFRIIKNDAGYHAFNVLNPTGVVCSGQTEVEAWILALEKMKEQA